MTMPTLPELGTDLLVTTRRQRVMALLRPYIGVALFVVAGWLGWWWVTPLLVFGIFVAVVTATHDVVHRTLGLTDRQTDLWLFLLRAGPAGERTRVPDDASTASPLCSPVPRTPKAIRPIFQPSSAPPFMDQCS